MECKASAVENDELLQEFLSEMIELLPSTPSCGPTRKRKQSLLEDLEEFVDVIGLDDLGSLEEMEVFSLDHNCNANFYGTENNNEETVLSSGVSSISNDEKKPNDKVVLEAGDVHSLLEQFEATAETKTEVVKEEPKPATKEPTLSPSIILKLREMRAERKKSILIPPKPNNNTKTSSSANPKLRRLLQKPKETALPADPIQCRLEHDYCSIEKENKKPDQPSPTKDEFFDNIPESDKKDICYDKLPQYLTCFTNEEKYKRSLTSRSRSVSECSTCSSCSMCSRSSCDSFQYRQSSICDNRGRSSRRKDSSGSADMSPHSRHRSSSSHSSKDRYYSRSRSRSRSRSLVRHWKRNPRRSPSYDPVKRRLASPIYKRNCYDSYNQSYSKTKYRQMPKMSNSTYQKKVRDIEERRVIYVGDIPEGTTRDYLRLRFQKFGHIEEVSVHFRDNRDNYGFVTFSNQADAYDAFENGNKDPNQPKFNLCFGGRRQFCQTRYADLDNIEDEDDDCWGEQFKVKKPEGNDLDFDSLLNAAKSRIGS